MNESVTHTGPFTLNEFGIVVLIVVCVLWALLPSVNNTLRFTHETNVANAAQAWRGSLQWLAMQSHAQGQRSERFDVARFGPGTVDLNAAGFPIGVSAKRNEPFELSREHCLALWNTLLGGAPPKAAINGPAIFRVLLSYQREHGLGCHYQYLLAGNMSIDYFPDDGSVLHDARFE